MTNYSDGLLVSIEGTDCSGKSTVIELLNEELSIIETAEPSDMWTGDAVYRALDNSSDTNPLVDFYLFLADREYHIINDIEHQLNRGSIVVSDRYSDSTRVYQPMMLQSHDYFDSIEEAEAFVERAMEPITLEPDLTLWIDTNLDTCKERMDEKERDSYETNEFLKQSYERFEALERKYDRIKQVDGNRPADEIAEACARIIEIFDE